ncbi:MAG: hypothetical protein EBX37_16425, partial [Alphaproteobacteria bacterium]|nr:hypothetical protein [Alphaproteobacteria bacterium]
LRQLAQQMQEFGIAPEELRQQVQPAPPPPARAPLPVPGMYVASLAGVGLLAAFAYGFWPSFSPALRLLLTLGVGMLLHVLAMTAWQKPRLWRLGQGLMLLAALWQGLGWFLLAQRALPGPAQEWACYMVAAALMLVQEAVVFRHYRHAFLLFYPLACAYALCLSLLIALGGHPIVILVGLGVSMLSLSWWLSRSTYAPLAGPWIMLGGALPFRRLPHHGLAGAFFSDLGFSGLAFAVSDAVPLGSENLLSALPLREAVPVASTGAGACCVGGTKACVRSGYSSAVSCNSPASTLLVGFLAQNSSSHCITPGTLWFGRMS